MAIGKLSDEKLVVLVREKDQELYRILVRRYQEKLLRYAQWLIGDQDRAADVVQQAFIKAFVNLRSFDTKKKFSSWVYRIVHNEAINLVKKEKKKISLEKNDWVNQLVDDRLSVEENLSRKEVQKMVNQGLKSLPVAYREPLALFYLDEKSYEEISDILRMPIGTVGTRINRGRKMLRLILEANGIKKS
jgi:RNA polymerase sigma-70 factor (ECF subfamily)